MVHHVSLCFTWEAINPPLGCLECSPCLPDLYLTYVQFQAFRASKVLSRSVNLTCSTLPDCVLNFSQGKSKDWLLKTYFFHLWSSFILCSQEKTKDGSWDATSRSIALSHWAAGISNMGTLVITGLSGWGMAQTTLKIFEEGLCMD